ncbi:LLM class flavin-dependent oxidoreductase [Paenibacillus flagellatus]|uniref:F420-dependent oxidoreductase n=1 Tax=Paenibacillus flagellatus TaxID=2211139 RepID=A0A2V5K9F2_9BACL|nr:LLM class flavin-dependent oxidoreductase [Paenibacillus flagellatus]PYI54533.1 F420-dependent oxidoreductase [Paenibacillus flagellatus]
MTVHRDDVEFGWYIPTHGDGHYLGVEPERESTADYMIQVARAAEEAGFTFALVPTGNQCMNGWIVAATVAAHTRTLRPLVAVQPGLIAPLYASRMAATLDRLTGGRALINVVTGNYKDLTENGDPLADASYHDERYERTREFLQVMRSAWSKPKVRNASEFYSGEALDPALKVRYEGSYYRIEGGASYPDPVTKPHPPIYFGGSSPIGKRVAAETADVYLMLAEPIDWMREQLDEMERYRSELRERTGVDRPLKYGVRIQVLVRDTEERAWEDAFRIIGKADEAAIRAGNERLAKTDSTIQHRMNRLRDRYKDNRYIIGPNMWSGLSNIRGGGGVQLVGTPEQVADRLLDYIDIGISSFIMSNYPHLEEAIHTGRHLLPVLKRKLAARSGAAASFDETSERKEAR